LGIGELHDGYGGIDGRNRRFKHHWKKFSNINARHFSRIELTVKAVLYFAESNGIYKFLAAE